MKLNITILILIILLKSNSITGQAEEDYLLKSRHQKTAAWILLGGGVALCMTGSLTELRGIADLFTTQSNNKINKGED